ncbi:protein DESIGUAL 2-like isoform X1 [Silene latifolia]|uniref:protein DESIGUAL 2-like isoform X1 n=1 Tax=Silene latifolia TaxID=37657 RepID=UPI003D77C09C
MAKIVGFFVCLLIIALDIGAGICGIEAEMAADKVKHLKLWIFECRDPSNEAFKFGVAAAGLMALAHIIANLFGVCFCFFSNSDHHKASPNRQLTTACLILSWIILAFGEFMLVMGTLSNEKARASCGFTHHHMLSVGGIICFVHCLFVVAYYLFATAAAN